jgi:hypothetical protein
MADRIRTRPAARASRHNSGLRAANPPDFKCGCHQLVNDIQNRRAETEQTGRLFTPLSKSVSTSGAVNAARSWRLWPSPAKQQQLSLIRQNRRWCAGRISDGIGVAHGFCLSETASPGVVADVHCKLRFSFFQS